MPGSGWLARLYFRVGIHTAPPGTLFFFVHQRLRALWNWRLGRYTSDDVSRRGAYGGRPYYDIARVRRTRQVDGLALVFFIGLGDYLLATPAIEGLRLAHPGLLIYAYVSDSKDAMNSPLVAHLLRVNRHIDAVFTYRGRARPRWFDYDFHDCLKDVPKHFLILPVIYDIDPMAFHRVTAVLEAFNLPVRWPIPPPILEQEELSPAASAKLGEIRQCASRHSARAVVCCHFDTRSSAYVYPRGDDVVRGLTRAGYVVVAFSASGVSDASVVSVDVASITPSDTIGLLRMLKGDACPLYIVSVNSVMWPISAALGIANLGLHIFHDPSIHQYLYPNIYVVTRYAYPRVSPSRMFVAQYGASGEQRSESGTVLVTFDARYVLDCFADMLDAIEGGERSRPSSTGAPIPGWREAGTLIARN
jgi:hypothetical protein